MLQRFYITIILLCFISTHFAFAQDEAESDSIKNLPSIVYTGTPKKYEIADIQVEGAPNYEDFTIIGLSGLAVGQTISVPGDEITDAVRRYWRHGLFSDVKISATKIDRNKIWLLISVKLRPRASEIRYHGVKKSEREDLEEKIRQQES